MIRFMSKKRMTIEDLTGMMNRNFPTKDEANSKFEEVKTEIREVKQDLWDVKIELEQVHEVVNRIDDKDLPNLKRRVTVLEGVTKHLRK